MTKSGYFMLPKRSLRAVALVHVYFYEDGDLLMDEVARYIGAALNRSHTGIVIARASFRHRLALELNLKHRRAEPVANQHGTLIALDAQETLDKFRWQAGRTKASSMVSLAIWSSAA